jgi:hypothetical protein
VAIANRLILTCIAALALSTCASISSPPGKPIAIESETIRYETAPCFGACPVFMIVIAPDGKGTFEGKRFTAVTGIRAFQATPDAYRVFAARLARYRPTENELLYQPGTPLCKNAPTDMSGVDIVWSELSGASQHLNVYYGCGPPEMRDALRKAPEVLPITTFIGGR